MKSHRSLQLLAALFAASVLIVTSAFAGESALEKASAALKAGDLVTAESLVAPLAGDDSKHAAALHLLSQIRMQQKKSKEAVELAERATKLDATKPEHFSQLGVAVSMRMGEVGFMQQAMMAGKMKGAFERSIELDPNHVSGLVGLSRYFSNAPEIAGGSPAKAREFAERVRAIVPHLGESELGRLAERSENWTEALAHYDAALAARPEAPGYLVAAARVLVKLERKDEARARLEAALELSPNFDPARKALATLNTPAKPQTP